MNDQVIAHRGLIAAGLNAYYTIQNEDGKFWDDADTGYLPADIASDDADRPMAAELGTTQRKATFPAAVTAGPVRITIRSHAATPNLDTDTIHDAYDRYWDGEVLRPSVQGVLTDIDQEPVPANRTWRLVPSSEGLVGEDRLFMSAGDVLTYAVDFTADMPLGGRIATVAAPTLEAGTGLTFPGRGRDKALAKIQIDSTAAAAGVYEIKVDVTYANGESSTGRVELEVVS